MWYKFSKPKWNYDIIVGIEYTYAYVKANNKQMAIAKLNKSKCFRKYDMRGLDYIDKVFIVPEDHYPLVIY